MATLTHKWLYAHNGMLNIAKRTIVIQHKFSTISNRHTVARVTILSTLSITHATIVLSLLYIHSINTNINVSTQNSSI